MWYSSGTVSATNNSNIITGTGTAFLANVRIGDGITIQGSQSLHEVIGIASNTQLTIKPAFTGTTGGGKQFACAPILGYDKDLSDAFNQLRLQFGDKLGALQPWAYAATANAALDALEFSATGKAIARGSAAQGRGALGLGAAATRDVALPQSMAGGDTGLLVPVGYCGIGAGYDFSTNGSDSARDRLPNGFYETKAGSVGDSANVPEDSGTWGHPFWNISRSSNSTEIRLLHSRLGITKNLWVLMRQSGETNFSSKFLRDSRNTTVDSNGFLKNASPIIKLHSDRIESNNEDGPAFERIDTGHYQLTGCNGLRLDDGWYIETPHDRNKVPYFNVEWEQDHTPVTDAGVLEEPADVALTIRCYERVWNPQTGQYDNGDPVDIPEGRWIDLRMNEVRQPEPEMPEDPEAPQQPTEPGAPIVPHMVTKAQGKTALIQSGLWQAVVDYVAAIEDETERMLAEVALHDAQDYRRDSPFLNAAADALGITEEQKDDLFILASSIVL